MNQLDDAESLLLLLLMMMMMKARLSYLSAALDSVVPHFHYEADHLAVAAWQVAMMMLAVSASLALHVSIRHQHNRLTWFDGDKMLHKIENMAMDDVVRSVRSAIAII